MKNKFPFRGDISLMKQSFIKALPLALTILALGVIFGAGANMSGISSSGAVFMSLLVFSGASQFAALNLWSLGGAGVLLSTAFLGSRFVLMSASLSVDMADLKLHEKAVLAFGIIDESYGLYTGESGDKDISSFGLYALIFYFSWFTGTVIGVSWGSFIPLVVQNFLQHVFPMVFLVLTVSAINSLSKAFVAILTVLLFGVGIRILPPGYLVLTSAVGASFLGLFLSGRGEGKLCRK